MTPEGKVQAHLQRRFKAIGGLVRKISYEGRRGCPDLFIVLPGGVVVMVEVKKPGGIPEPHQTREIVRLRQRGVPVYVIDTIEDADKLVAFYS